MLNKLENKNVRIVNMDDIENYLPRLIHKSFESKLSFYDIIDRPKKIPENFILPKGLPKIEIILSILCIEVNIT